MTPETAVCIKCEVEGAPRHCQNSPTCSWYRCPFCKIVFHPLSGRVMPGVGK